MPFLRSKTKQLAIFLGFCLLISSHAVYSKKNITIAVLSDFIDQSTNSIVSDDLLIDELTSLVSPEVALSFKHHQVQSGLEQQLKGIYQDPDIDMVLVLSFFATQKIVAFDSFAKPTFLPKVVEPQLLNAPTNGNASGKPNLNYLSSYSNLVDYFGAIKKIVSFSKVAVLVDEILLYDIPDAFADAVQTIGTTMTHIPAKGSPEEILASLPADTEAVLFSELSRMNQSDLERVIEGVNRKRLPSFSYHGKRMVKLGVLASPTNEVEHLQIARMNALNMQAVILGGKASKQPIWIERPIQLTINLDTAERIGVDINFTALAEADVIHDNYLGGVSPITNYSLSNVASVAIGSNLDLKSAQYDVAISEADKRLARSNLFPSASVQASATQRKEDSIAVNAGTLAEESHDANIQLNQLVYSESAWSGYTSSGYLLDAAIQGYDSTELDIIQNAINAMIDVLNAQSQVRIQQENLSLTKRNLELAENRAKIGAANLSDQYRWQNQLANATSNLLSSHVTLIKATENFNRILNRPLNEAFTIEEIDKDTVFVFTVDELFSRLKNSASIRKLNQFLSARAIEDRPEIKQINALIYAKERSLTSLQRRRWLPDLSLTARVTENLHQDQALANQDERDWSVMLNASIPIFEGGKIRADIHKADLELQKLHIQRVDLINSIQQNIHATTSDLALALYDLDLTREATIAAKNNLELVRNGYRNGVLSVVDLLDAQNASLSANIAQVNAGYQFVRSGVNLQRAEGVYQFMFTASDRTEFRDSINAAIEKEKNNDN